MSRWPDYDRLLQPFVAKSADSVLIPGSTRRIGAGYVGDVFECKLQSTGEQVVMKTPKTDIQMWSRTTDDGSQNQRWLQTACDGDDGYFLFFSEAFPSRVLEIYKGEENAHARLSLGEVRQRARHQKWRLDSEGRLVSKLDNSKCMASSSSERGARVRVETVKNPLELNQRWELQSVKGGAKLIVSLLNNRVVDFVGETDSRELYYLARWRYEPGVVQLRHVVWGNGNTLPFFIMKRLGRQLGPGTEAFEKSDCVLRDISTVKACRRTPAQAAQQLLAVSCFLRRMHLAGYTHNDLHDGNILEDCSSAAGARPFLVIDLGSVHEAGHWKSELGFAYGRSWSVTRDWRAFSLSFLALIDGKVRNIWDLVGTSNKLPKLDTDWAVPWQVKVAANVANGSQAQKWTVDKKKHIITNRGNNKVLDLSAGDDSSAIVFPFHGGPNQKWKFVDGTIENPAKRLKLDICGGIHGSSVIAHDGNGEENQLWHYDQVSAEIVNPANRKVLDVHGEVRLPEDVCQLISSTGAEADSVFVQLLHALFKARSDPHEICALVGLLASRS